MSSRSARFAVLLFWNALSFTVSVIGGVVLSRQVVQGLGIQAFGVWALVFSMLDYLNIADLGIRSATVKYVAEYSALNNLPRLYKTLNASILYFSCIALVVTLAVFLGAKPSARLFNIPHELESDYVVLLRMTGFTMTLQLLFNVAKAALEGLQNFPAISRINISVSVIRTSLCLLSLHYKMGLLGLGWATVVAFWCGFVMLGWVFRKSFPGFRILSGEFDRAIFRQLLHYGLPTLLGTVSLQFLQNGPIVLLAMMKDTASVGYFSLVLRLLTNLYEVLSQVGSMTSSLSARLAAEDDRGALRRTVLYLNRYSFAMFIFVYLFLLLFGRSLFTVWVGPVVAEHCLPLIPWLGFGFAFGSSAHIHSIGTLFGMAKHRAYNYGVVVESLIMLCGWLLFLPSRPLWVAAAWWAVSLFLGRGLRPSWSVSRALGIPYSGMLASIYVRPLLASVLTTLVGLALLYFVPPSTLFGVLATAASLGLFHLAACYGIVLAAEHRHALKNIRSGIAAPA